MKGYNLNTFKISRVEIFKIHMNITQCLLEIGVGSLKEKTNT